MEDVQRALTVLQNAEQPLSTNEVAERMDVDWHTAKKRLNTLVQQKKAYRSELSDRLTLYWDQQMPF